MININNLFFSCKSERIDEKIILNNINLSIESGQSVILAGNNGSGKTLLFKVITGEIIPLIGNIKIDGKNITEFSKTELAQTISMVNGKLENFIVNNLTFIENIYLYTMQHNKISMINGIDKARKLSLIDDIKKMDLGIDIDSIATKKVSELPNYYKHLLLILIAIVNNPKILILDDIFADIDVNDLEYVFPVVKKICDLKKFTVILSTDNTYIIGKICDRIIVLSNGIIVFDEKSGNNLDIQKITDMFNHHLKKALMSLSSKCPLYITKQEHGDATPVKQTTTKVEK